MEKVLVSGGAGYIGSVLVRLLLQRGYSVRVIDLLNFGGEPILDLLSNPYFEFVKGDIRNNDDVTKAVKGVDKIVHLAAIVGDPACSKQPELARSTNFHGSALFYEIANKHNIKQFVFASTCSNYGKMVNPNSFVDETSELAPVSLYAETKVATEEHLLNQPRVNFCKPTCLRFSTAYGLSLRPRFDLTINEFTKELALGRELLIFGKQFWRPYCHIIDLSRAVIQVLESPIKNVEFEVFNVGDTKENYQKEMIVNEIKILIPTAVVKYISKNEDPRDYRVNFGKIKSQIGFSISKKITDGIKETIKAIQYGFILNPDDEKYKNV